MIAITSYRIISSIVETAASLSTMSDHIGITVLFIIVPVALVASVALILLRLPPPPQSVSLRRGKPARHIRRVAPVFTHTDSWPDLESQTLHRAQPLAQAPRSGDIDKLGLEAPASVWNPTRQNRLNWGFTMRNSPTRHPK